MDEERLIVDPRPVPPPDEIDSPYDTISVDLRLHGDVFIPKKGLGIAFDKPASGWGETLGEMFRRKSIDPDGWPLPPNQFVLGQTIERIGLPVAGRLAARVEGRSSLARVGLLIHFTAPTIHAGWNGRIALEIINLGPYNITLRPEMEVCQLIVETVEGESISADSQFQGQRDPTGRT